MLFRREFKIEKYLYMKKVLLFVLATFISGAMLINYTGCSKKPAVILVTGVTINTTTLPLIVGSKATITVTISPSNATNKGVTWSSGNSAVATVNAATGEVTAVAPGTAVITVTTASGSKTATCTVTVTAPIAPTIAVSSSGLTNLKVGQSISDATIVFTLTNGTYATTITPGDFVVSNLPSGLTASAPTRTGNTVTTVIITGKPTAYKATSDNITLPASIPAANITGATAPVTLAGTVTVSAIALGDGAALNGAPYRSGLPAVTSIIVNPVTISSGVNPGNQVPEYAINESSTNEPTSGWSANHAFYNLIPASTYYVWARAAQNANYAAGPARCSLPLITLSSESDVPFITTSSLPSGTVGEPYNFTLSASGVTPISWFFDETLDGLNLNVNPSTGVITGTPSVAGTYSFWIGAMNAAGADEQPWTITINPASKTVTIKDQSNPIFATGGTITFPVTTTNIPNGATRAVRFTDIDGYPIPTFGETITVSNVSNNSATVTVNIPVISPNTTLYFTVTIDGVTSAVKSFAVLPTNARTITIGDWTTGLLPSMLIFSITTTNINNGVSGTGYMTNSSGTTITSLINVTVSNVSNNSATATLTYQGAGMQPIMGTHYFKVTIDGVTVMKSFTR